MPEGFARSAAVALLLIFLIAFVLLISLFSGILARPNVIPTAQIALASVTPSGTPVPAVPTPMPSSTPTLAPASPPLTSCPSPATPEPLWVDPVMSPTNQLTQKISVTLGRGVEITIAGEAGTVIQPGHFSVGAPAQIQVQLVPNSTNHLTVSGRVEYMPGCFYSLQTPNDRLGNPLTIVQSNAPNSGVTPSNLTPTPSVPRTGFLKPFSQVFALNQDSPSPNNQLWLYEANDNAPFNLPAQQGAFTHLISQDGTLNFWTLNENVANTPPPAPTFDTTMAGQSVQFVSASIFACEAQSPTSAILGMCGQVSDLTQVQLIERATVDSAILYLLSLNGKTYWVSSAVFATPP